MFAENFNCLSANALPAVMANDKKLSQINCLCLLAIQSVSHNFPLIFKNHRRVFAGQPAAHPLFQFGQGHLLVPMTFILK